MKKVVRHLVHQLMENSLIEEAQRDEYVYFLQCFIEGTITTGSILILGICFGKFMPTIIFLIFFFSLRRRTGGFHLDTFARCYVGTLILYVMVIFFARYMVNCLELLASLTIASYISIFMIGTINHPNIGMSKEEFMAAKVSARTLSTLLILFIGFLWWTRFNMEIIVYMCLSVILCAGLLMIAKLIRQEVRVDE